MKTLEYYIHCFTHLRRAPNNGGAPHKPILLLSVIDCIEKGYIYNNQIHITPELIAFFKSNWSIWVTSNHLMNFALPFYHMSGEPFWKLITKYGQDISLTKKGSIKSFLTLNTVIEYASIDNELYTFLCNEKDRLVLKKVLIDRYFNNIQPAETSNSYYLKEIEHDMLCDSSAEYQAKIRTIKKRENEENFEEEIYLRSNIFKRTIPKIYNHTCCITGLNINCTYNLSMIDACHIVPFNETHDDTIGNGITLCPNLHRAFDRGLITIDENYTIIVSKNFSENQKSTHSLKQFDNKRILLPDNKKFYPNKENLQWHNMKIFK